jgi:exopolysaccharide production protein ExoZ
MRSHFARRLARLYELPAAAGRLPAMEGVRGFAVLLVFSVHFHSLFSSWLSPESLLFRVSTFFGTIGHSGVDLFFMLSGYLIYGKLIRRPGGYARFLKRRAWRIYPVFAVALTAYLFLHFTVAPNPAMPTGFRPAAVYVLQNVLLLPGVLQIQPLLTVAWSLSYEVFFYAAIPLLIELLRMRAWQPATRCLLFVVLACLYAVIHLQYAGFSIPWLRLYPAAHPRMLMFIGGILLFEAHSARIGAPLGSWGEVIAGVLLLSGFAASYLLLTNAGLVAHVRTALWNVVAVMAGFGPFLFFALDRRGLLHWLLCRTPLRWLGNMSYSYYLFHGLLLHGVKLAVKSAIPPETHSGLLFYGLLVVSLPLTFACTTLVFTVIEKPFSLAPAASKRSSDAIARVAAGHGACA